MKENILIVAYIFPPTPGIGGRRWAKFAKYFTRIGYHVHVICSEQSNAEVSLWNEDVKNNKNITLYKIPQKYPAILSTTPKALIEKIKYHLAILGLRLKTKGSLFDKSIFWGTDFISLAEKIINENNITKVFSTVAPLHHSFQLISIKSKFKKTKFIVDFRDPWTNGIGYGFPQKNKKRQKNEFEKERIVHQKFDLITSPFVEVIESSSNYFVIPFSKYFLLVHAIDTDDFTFSETQNIPNLVTEIIVYGTLYSNLKSTFDLIFSTLNKLENVLLKLYIVNPKTDYFERADKGKYEIHPAVEPKKLFQKIIQANYVMIIYNSSQEVWMYTKIVEIIYLRKPMIIIGNKNNTTEFIEANRLGFHISYAEIETKLPRVIASGIMENYNSTFDISHFTFLETAKRLMDKVNSL